MRIGITTTRDASCSAEGYLQEMIVEKGGTRDSVTREKRWQTSRRTI
jgi:hypothetical protein